jgi:DNA uptake protein ComE-like DNA-binding protein
MQQIEETLAYALGLTLRKREVDDALEEAKAQISGLQEELLAKNIEIAMTEKMYDKALEMLAGVHLTKDLQSPVRKKTEVVAPKVPRIVEDEPEVDEEIDTRIAVESKSTGKVNVNTASAKEIRERTGLPMVVVYNVTAYRKQNGPFGSLEDLLKTAKFTEYHLREYGKMLTV